MKKVLKPRCLANITSVSFVFNLKVHWLQMIFREHVAIEIDMENFWSLAGKMHRLERSTTRLII